jgi:hypothetical protein
VPTEIKHACYASTFTFLDMYVVSSDQQVILRNSQRKKKTVYGPWKFEFRYKYIGHNISYRKGQKTKACIQISIAR